MAILQPGDTAYYIRNLVESATDISPVIYRDTVVETHIKETLNEEVSPPEVVIEVHYKLENYASINGVPLSVLVNGEYVFDSVANLIEFLEDNIQNEEDPAPAP